MSKLWELVFQPSNRAFNRRSKFQKMDFLRLTIVYHAGRRGIICSKVTFQNSDSWNLKMNRSYHMILYMSKIKEILRGIRQKHIGSSITVSYPMPYRICFRKIRRKCGHVFIHRYSRVLLGLYFICPIYGDIFTIRSPCDVIKSSIT